jgi:hypothetical protein
MHPSLRLLVAAGAALLVSAAPLAAQSAQPATGLVFRPGQWGAEFGVTNNFPSVGFMRFRSDRSAWLVNVNVNYVTYEDTFQPPFGGTEESNDNSQHDVTIAAGLRQYRPVLERAAAFTTFGALAGSFGEKQTSETAPTEELSGWQAGAFGELGGTWLLTRNMGLGASFQSSFVYFNSSVTLEGQGEATRKGFAFNAGETRLLLTLFF